MWSYCRTCVRGNGTIFPSSHPRRRPFPLAAPSAPPFFCCFAAPAAPPKSRRGACGAAVFPKPDRFLLVLVQEPAKLRKNEQNPEFGSRNKKKSKKQEVLFFTALELGPSPTIAPCPPTRGSRSLRLAGQRASRRARCFEAGDEPGSAQGHRARWCMARVTCRSWTMMSTPTTPPLPNPAVILYTRICQGPRALRLRAAYLWVSLSGTSRRNCSASKQTWTQQRRRSDSVRRPLNLSPPT